MTVINDDLIEKYKIFDPFHLKTTQDENQALILSHGVSSFGYDLRLSDKEFFIFGDNDTDQELIIDPKKFDKRIGYFSKTITDLSGTYYKLPPKSYALGVSVENITMQPDQIGVCIGKSSYARSGLLINCTPLEPGWHGFLTIEMYNTTHYPMKVYANEGILQVIIYKGIKPVTTYRGKYQDQNNQITFAK